MQTTNLYPYIKSWTFLEAVTALPHAIIWEKKPDLSHLGASRSSIDSIELSQLWYDFRADGDVSRYIAEKKNVFLLLDTLSVGSCKDMLASLHADVQVKIINLWVGITGVQNKHTIENNDYAIVGEIMPIYEPIDTTQFLQMVNAPASMYIRIANDEIADNLFSWEHAHLYAERDIPMTAFGYSGSNGTIIVQPSLLVTVTQVLQHLQTTNGLWFDLFVHTGPHDIYSEQLTQSLDHTGKLIYIHDQASSDAIRAIEHKVSKASALHGELAVSFKNPDYTKITTILPEYMYEQIWYSTESLVHYLTSLA